MMSRIVLATVAVAALTYGMMAIAQDSPAPTAPKAGDASQIKESLSLKEQILARQYQEFEQQLLRLKQRLERSPKQEDRDRALVLDRVLEYCKEKSLSVQFEQMVDILKSKELKSLPDIKDALSRSSDIAEELRAVIAMLREDSRAKAIRGERERIEQILKDLENIIQHQKSAQGLTDNNKTDKNELKNIQNKVTKDTKNLLDRLDGKNGDGKNSKGDPKASGKNGDKAGQAKDDGEKNASDKSAQAKDGGDGQEPKGASKSSDGDPKSGDKSGDPAQAKSGDGPKDGGDKSGDKGNKGPDSAQAKGDPKAGDGNKGDPKSGDKAGDKGGDPAQAKAGGDKAGDKGGDKGSPSQAKAGDKAGDGGKSGQAKESKAGGESGQAKGGEGKPSEGGGKGKPSQAKSGDKSDGQSQAKGDGQDSGGQPKQGSPSASNKDNGGKKPPQQAQDNPPNGKKQIQDGNYKQEKAEENIQQGKNDDASNDQSGAIKDLEKAKKELEKLLRQLREEELERLLAALQARCEKMLAMQIQVYNGTMAVDKVIAGLVDKQPNLENKKESLKLSDTEGEIVLEASKAIEILEAEGSAIAFPEVFQQVRDDMKHVQRRLGITDVGNVTQAIEKDIIDSLKEMIDALKKQRQDLADSKSKPGPPGPPPPNQDQKLLEKIAELKMIRSMQIRVNDRTKTYGKMYEGEQTGDPNIRRELHNLSERQERIFDITNRMAKGDNR